MTLSFLYLEIFYILSYTSVIHMQNVSWISERAILSRVQNEGKLTGEEKHLYVHLHNMYRGKVSIPASNMKYMEWSEDLARIAQDWVNKCEWDHGNLNDPIIGRMGQNLYKGHTRNPNRAMKLWFDEYSLYNFHDISCKPDKQCGHYTQVVWADSQLVGCALKIGCWDDQKFYIGCNYYPPGNFNGKQPFKVGEPCSQCSEDNGGLCSDRLCVTKDQCAKYTLTCDCNLKCYNCGTLDKKQCKCKCKSGWDGIDCSTPCVDEDKSCRKFMCTNYQELSKSKCRKTCGFCKTVNKSDLLDTCCDGEMCPNGYVLNQFRPCSCDFLCPGPKCYASGTNSFEESIITIFILVVVFIIRHLI